MGKEVSVNDIVKALGFYKVVMRALKTPGIDKIVVTLADDGELEANVLEDK